MLTKTTQITGATKAHERPLRVDNQQRICSFPYPSKRVTPALMPTISTGNPEETTEQKPVMIGKDIQ